mgnify:CR=1 FL=1
MMRALLFAACAGATCLVAGALLAQEPPRLTGPTPFTKEAPATPMQRQVTDDIPRQRNYPAQPPLIPHSTERYAPHLTANTRPSCPARQFTAQSPAPPHRRTH